MNPSEGEGISRENTLTAEQREKQIQDSNTLRLLIDRSLQSAAHDIKQEYGLVQRASINHMRDLALDNSKLEDDLFKVRVELKKMLNRFVCRQDHLKQEIL